MFSNDFVPNTHNGFLSYSLFGESSKRYILYSVKKHTNLFNVKKPIYECIRAAEIIANSCGNIFIAMSGGVDSETVAISFMEAGIAITAVLLIFKDDFNDYEINRAKAFCKAKKIKYVEVILDLNEFYKKELHLQYAEKYFCRSPQIATHLWLIENFNEKLIFAYNPLPIFSTGRKITILPPPLMYHCYDYCMKINGKCGVGLFHLYTYELMMSFLKLDLNWHILFDCNFVRNYCPENYSIKTELYRAGGFEINATHKYTGFEKYRRYLNEINGYKGKDYFDDFYRNPMKKLSRDEELNLFLDLDIEELFLSKNQAE